MYTSHEKLFGVEFANTLDLLFPNNSGLLVRENNIAIAEEERDVIWYEFFLL